MEMEAAEALALVNSDAFQRLLDFQAFQREYGLKAQGISSPRPDIPAVIPPS